MNAITRNIPNSVTLLNLAAGTTAIILASHGLEQIGSLQAWQWAAICIGIAAVADFLDGFCARLLHAYSNLGKELDSLCDLVSFGVAPAMILHYVLSELNVAPWLPWTVILIPLAGALRLAKFNIDTRQTTSFIGLPIPANAIFWIGFTSLLAANVETLQNPFLFCGVLLVECWLMVSPLPLFSLKFKNYAIKGNEARYILIIAAILFLFCTGVAGLMWLIIFYLLLSQLPFARSK